MKLPLTATGGLKSIGWFPRDRLTIRDADEMPVAICRDEEPMRRIILCVNSFDDLLEACKAILHSLMSYRPDCNTACVSLAAVRKIEAAIAKAKPKE